MKRASVLETKVLVNRNFACTWVGNFISGLGDSVYTTTLVLWVVVELAHGQSWAPLAVSGISLADALALLILRPVAGVFADRWKDKRGMMMRMDMARAVLIAVLLIASTIGQKLFPPLWLLLIIYLMSFLVSLCTQFFTPLGTILFYDIVEEAYRARASGLSQFNVSLIMMIGPTLATILFFTTGVTWALILDAGSFIVSFLCLWAAQVPASHKAQAAASEGQEPVVQQFVAGIRFHFGNAVLKTLLISAVLVTFWVVVLQVLNVFFVGENLHAPTSFYGYLGTAGGVGFALGALFGSAFASRIGVTRLLWSALVALGLLIIVYSRLTSWLPALIVTCLLNFCVPLINLSVGPLVFHVTPRAFLGRSSTVINFILTLTSMLSAVLIGWLNSVALRHFHAVILNISLGPIDTIFLVVGLLAIGSGINAMVRLRGVSVVSQNNIRFSIS